MKKIFPIALLTVFLVVIVMYVFFSQKQEITPITTNDTVTVTPNVPNGWTENSNSNFQLNFSTPPSAQVSESGDLLRIYYMGEKQRASGRTQTELADGYIITVTKMPTEDNQTLTQLANLRSEQTKNSCPTDAIITDLDDTLVGNIPAQMYSVRNCRGDSEQYYIQVNDTFYEVTTIFPGYTPEDAATYKALADSILDTFKQL